MSKNNHKSPIGNSLRAGFFALAIGLSLVSCAPSGAYAARGDKARDSGNTADFFRTVRENMQKEQERKAAASSTHASSTASGTNAGTAATPTSSVAPNASGIAPFTGSTSAQTTSVYTAIVEAAPAAPKAKVIMPYSAEAVINTFFPSESYPDGGFGKAASVSLTLGAIVSGIAGALSLNGKLAAVAFHARKIFQ